MITIINNQPIRFRNSEEIDESCECLGHSFCQPINKNDATQFQIKSSSGITNGDFETDLTGWNVFEAVDITLVSFLNATEGECNGEFEVSATGGIPGYTYSIDGVTFQASPLFENLCEGTYYVNVKDSVGNIGVLVVTVFENIDCSEYSGSTIQDLIDAGITLGQLYNCTLGDLQ